MKTVIDVGCARYGGDYSIERLIEMHSPDVLYGFDPNGGSDWGDRLTYPELGDNWIAFRATLDGFDTDIQVSRSAAWTHDGEVRFLADGLAGMVGNHDHWPLVPCIDLARFIDELPAGELILKLDAEGAEIDLLEHLIKTKVDLRLSLVIVEWHPWNDERRRRRIEQRLTCPLEVWPW